MICFVKNWSIFLCTSTIFENQTDLRLVSWMQSGRFLQSYISVSILDSIINFFELKVYRWIFCVVFYLCYNNLCTCKFIPTFFKKLNFDFRMQKSRSVCHINFSCEVLSIYRNLWIVKYDLTPFNLFYRVIKFFVFCLQIVWIIIHSNMKTLNSDLSIMKCTFFWSIFCLSTEFTWKLWLSDP